MFTKHFNWHFVLLSYIFFTQSGPLNVAAYREFRVSGSEEFQHVLDKARPGDQIYLSSGVYHGPFSTSASGSGDDYIQLGTFSRDKVQIVGNGVDPAITLKGDNWYISDLSIFNNNSIGFLISGSNNIIANLKITKVDTAIQVNGLSNIVENNYIFRANTGVYLKGNGTMLINNVFHERNVTCVRTGKVSCCGRLIGNVCLFGDDVEEGKDYVVVGGTSRH